MNTGVVKFRTEFDESGGVRIGTAWSGDFHFVLYIEETRAFGITAIRWFLRQIVIPTPRFVEHIVASVPANI